MFLCADVADIFTQGTHCFDDDGYVRRDSIGYGQHHEPERCPDYDESLQAVDQTKGDR